MKLAVPESGQMLVTDKESGLWRALVLLLLEIFDIFNKNQ
jgi:hypothetical protein